MAVSYIHRISAFFPTLHLSYRIASLRPKIFFDEKKKKRKIGWDYFKIKALKSKHEPIMMIYYSEFSFTVKNISSSAHSLSCLHFNFAFVNLQSFILP